MKANKKFSFRVFLFFSNAKILDYSHFDNDRAKGETFNTPIKRNDKQSNRRQTRGVARKKMAMGGTLARIVSVKQKYRQIQKEKDRANWRVLDIAFDVRYVYIFPTFFPNSTYYFALSINGWKRFQSNLLRWINLEVDQFRRIKSFHPSRERIFRQLILAYWKLNETRLMYR